VRSQSRSLPNSRVTPSNANICTPFNPLIFQLLRLLSIVPAFLGSCYHLYHLIFAKPPYLPNRIDSLVALSFALVTLKAHLGLTTGLLLRWRTFYAPMAVLVRLLALQSICWPATHLTLLILSHSKRPAVCWAVIGSTTCVSRSIQMWVCSNLAVIRSPEHIPHGKRFNRFKRLLMPPAPLPLRSRPRKWDWSRVLLRCGLPLGICYFVMAWGEIAKREFHDYST
jgi:N-glycosylation protein